MNSSAHLMGAMFATSNTELGSHESTSSGSVQEVRRVRAMARSQVVWCYACFSKAQDRCIPAYASKSRTLGGRWCLL